MEHFQRSRTTFPHLPFVSTTFVYRPYPVHNIDWPGFNYINIKINIAHNYYYILKMKIIFRAGFQMGGGKVPNDAFLEPLQADSSAAIQRSSAIVKLILQI